MDKTWRFSCSHMPYMFEANYRKGNTMKRQRVKNKIKSKLSDFKDTRWAASLIYIIVGVVIFFTCFDTKANEQITVPKFNDARNARLDTQQLLATNLYHEARNQSDLANFVILAVVENRKNLGERYGNTYEQVIFKPKAFSWLDDGLSDRMYEVKQYRRLYRLTERFLLNKEMYMHIAQGADHYHKVGHKTTWDYSKLDLLFRIDDHVFYKHK